MENLTHSLFGATLAELALPADATPAQRRLFSTAGVVAANLPDADLLYSGIMPPPLGYLLHHRGHTHTLVGLLAQGALIGGVMMIPRLRATWRGVGVRLWALVSLALVSHVALDSWNVYGVHPFWPFDNSWYYGDAVSIFEPWLWMILGLCAAANAHGIRVRRVLFALPIVLVALTGAIGLVQMTSAVLLLVAAALMWSVGRRLTPHRRSIAALAASAVFVVSSFMLSMTARARVAEAFGDGTHEQTLDIAVSPRPAQPLCWNAWTVRRNDSESSYSLSRASVSVAPRALSLLGCGADGVQLTSHGTHAVQPLVLLMERDCYVRIWMQFARFPWIENADIVDARFDEPGRQSFTALRFRPSGRACPAHVTSWGMPRTDLITTVRQPD